MNHFLLTRFNIKIWTCGDKRGNAIQTEEWLEERFRLFDAYCWRSVMAQTCKNFRWICLFDADTPQKFKSRIDEYRKQWDGFLPYYITKREAPCFQDYFRQLVSELGDENDEGLLTTYLDNDDCLHRDFIKLLQESVKDAKYGTIISFKYGIQYYEELRLAVRIPYPNNHFLTLYERMSRDRVRTVWSFGHFFIFKYNNVCIDLIDNKRQPMWIELIHAGNMDNDVKMTACQRLLLGRDTLAAFGIEKKLPSAPSLLFVFLTAFQWRFICQMVRRLKNKVYATE